MDTSVQETAKPQTKHLCILRRKQGGFGGAEKVVERFLAAFQGAWKVSVIHEGDSVDGMQIGTEHGSNWKRAQKFAQDVDTCFQQERPDIIFSMERGPDCDVYRAGDGVHKRWIEIRHGRSWKWMFNPWHWIAPKLERKTLASVRAIIANSKMVRDDLIRYYPECAEKISVIYNGFKPTQYQRTQEPKAELRRQLGLDAACQGVLFCGSGWERKGLKQSIEFIAHLKQLDSTKPCRLWVLGKGKPKRYESLIKQLGVEGSVVFLPPTKNVATYYQAADLFILPTAYDPFSNATLEALACDCPVITTQTNGVSEVVQQGATGFVLERLDEKALKAAAGWWLGYEHKVGQVSESVSHLTEDTELAKLNTLFRGLMEQ